MQRIKRYLLMKYKRDFTGLKIERVLTSPAVAEYNFPGSEYVIFEVDELVLNGSRRGPEEEGSDGQ